MSRRTDLPSMALCNGCGECCGPAAARPQEVKRIRGFVRDNAIAWRVDPSSPLTCGFSRPTDAGAECAIYPVRPWVCRAFGVIAELPCKYFPEAVVLSFPADQAVAIGVSRPGDKLLGEVFESGYLRRLASIGGAS